jgi:hypothetical protein
MVQHEHRLGEAVEHALTDGSARVVLDEHQARERIQLGRGTAAFSRVIPTSQTTGHPKVALRQFANAGRT